METIQFFSPGRVNIIGEHIDYNGGLVMPIAIAQGIKAEVQFRTDNIIEISSKQIAGTATFNLAKTKETAQKNNEWTDYVLGVIHYLQRENKAIDGCNIEISSNLPLGSGLSSSAALEVLIAYLLQYKQKNNIDLTELALFCQRVENEFVGVNCGIMDQFAVANGQKGKAMCLDCDTLDCQQIPFELGEYCLVLMNSKQPRELAGSAYNIRRAQCEQALAIIQEQQAVENLCAAQISDLEFLKDEVIYKRAKHVISEQQRVLQSVEALKQGNIPLLGKLLTASHISLDKDYEVSSEGLNLLVNTSIEQDICLGARLTGAGFGGCCIALVKKDAVNSFQEKIAEVYFERYRMYPDFYITNAEDGVRSL